MAIKESNLLELPEAPEFISKPPTYSFDEIIRLSIPLLPYWNEQRYSKPRPRFIGEAFSLELKIGAANDESDTKMHGSKD